MPMSLCSIRWLLAIAIATALFIPGVHPQYDACTVCTNAEGILSSCQQPALINPPEPGSLQLTKQIIIDGDGPFTYRLTNLSSASCVCSKGAKDYTDCIDCLGEHWTNFDRVTRNRANDITASAKFYLSDCAAYGYFPDPLQGGPTTTRAAFPIATAPPEASIPGCSLCDVIASQAQECNLPPINQKPNTQAKPVPIGSGDQTSVRDFLYNRTSAECMCTIPVLRRFQGCRICDPSGFGLNDPLIGYDNDCKHMGYWRDETLNAPPPTISSLVANGAIKSKLPLCQNMMWIYTVIVAEMVYLCIL